MSGTDKAPAMRVAVIGAGCVSQLVNVATANIRLVQED